METPQLSRKHIPYLSRWAKAILTVLGLGSLLPCAQAVTLADIQFSFANGKGQVTVAPAQDKYFVLQRSSNLKTFVGVDVARGREPILEISEAATARLGFFRVEEASVYAPRDTDRDGMDDLYELDHPETLNPVDPTDAGKDPDGNKKTNLQEYRERYGITLGQFPEQSISREVSIFAAGTGTNIGREIVISREVSVFNNLGIPQEAVNAHSREVSVYNLGSSAEGREAVSREISIYNLHSNESADIISREVSVRIGPNN